jgi:acetyl esterase
LQHNHKVWRTLNKEVIVMKNMSQDLEKYKKICEEIDPSEGKSSIYEQRESYLNLFRAFPVTRPQRIVAFDDSVATTSHIIPMRIFRTKEAGDCEPCIIYAHGGGFIAGDLEASDSIAADLADRLNVTVITFHYRLSPEFHYPEPLEDCYSVLLSVMERASQYGVNPKRVIFAGESCGGNFAVAISLLTRARSGPRLFALVSINPVFNVHRWARREVDNCPESFSIEMYHYTANYLGDNMDLLPEYASPLLAQDLSGLPPTFIWAAEIDPLCEEAKMFSEKLKSFEVLCQLHIHEGVVHGCLRARHHYTFAAQAFHSLCDGIQNLLKHHG